MGLGGGRACRLWRSEQILAGGQALLRFSHLSGPPSRQGCGLPLPWGATLSSILAQGKGGLVLFFYPKAATPGCTKEVRRGTQRRPLAPRRPGGPRARARQHPAGPRHLRRRRGPRPGPRRAARCSPRRILQAPAPRLPPNSGVPARSTDPLSPLPAAPPRCPSLLPSPPPHPAAPAPAKPRCASSAVVALSLCISSGKHSPGPRAASAMERRARRLGPRRATRAARRRGLRTAARRGRGRVPGPRGVALRGAEGHVHAEGRSPAGWCQ
jgi:hypothetical protein